MIIPVDHSIILKTIVPFLHEAADLVISEVWFKTIQSKILNTSQNCLRLSGCNINPWFGAELACACVIALAKDISFTGVSSIVIKTLGGWRP